MKRIVLVILGLLLMLPVEAQIMRSKSTTLGTRVVSTGTSKTKKQTLTYIGLGSGPVNTIEDFSSAAPFFFPAFIEGGVIHALADIENTAVPFVGVDVALGLNLSSGNFAPYFQSGPFVGLLIGKPSFRFDLRLQPSFNYCVDGLRNESVAGGEYGTTVHTSWIKDYGGVLLTTEASVWLGHFNVGIRYVPLYKGIMGRIRWRF